MAHQIDLDDAVVYYRPLAPAEVIEAIRGLNFQDPRWLFGDVEDLAPYQGDIVPEGDICWLASDGAPVVYHGPVMLLSHGCDAVEGRDPVATLAPVLDLGEYLSRLPAGQRPSQYDVISKNRVTNIFYLPEYGAHPQRIVHFSYASAVPTEVIDRLFRETDTSQRLRLSHGGWYLLTCKLTHHVARLERAEDYPRQGRPDA